MKVAFLISGGNPNWKPREPIIQLPDVPKTRYPPRKCKRPECTVIFSPLYKPDTEYCCRLCVSTDIARIRIEEKERARAENRT
jgi:hypothetical protein